MNFEVVNGTCFWLWLPSVCSASQTSAAMMTSGKSALRKKRFTGSPGGGYQRHVVVTAPRGPRLRAFEHERLVQDADVGQIPVALGEVEAVPDHEAVRDLEARVADRDVDLPALGLGQQRADLEARRPPRLEIAHEIRERQARVDDVLDDESVPALDVDVKILEDPHDARGVGRRAVARDRHEVDLAGHGQVAHQV